MNSAYNFNYGNVYSNRMTIAYNHAQRNKQTHASTHVHAPKSIHNIDDNINKYSNVQTLSHMQTQIQTHTYNNNSLNNNNYPNIHTNTNTHTHTHTNTYTSSHVSTDMGGLGLTMSTSFLGLSSMDWPSMLNIAELGGEPEMTVPLSKYI